MKDYDFVGRGMFWMRRERETRERGLFDGERAE
jgi:hypothetical protein